MTKRSSRQIPSRRKACHGEAYPGRSGSGRGLPSLDGKSGSGHRAADAVGEQMDRFARRLPIQEALSCCPVGNAAGGAQPRNQHAIARGAEQRGNGAASNWPASGVPPAPGRSRRSRGPGQWATAASGYSSALGVGVGSVKNMETRDEESPRWAMPFQACAAGKDVLGRQASSARRRALVRASTWARAAVPAATSPGRARRDWTTRSRVPRRKGYQTSPPGAHGYRRQRSPNSMKPRLDGDENGAGQGKRHTVSPDGYCVCTEANPSSFCAPALYDPVSAVGRKLTIGYPEGRRGTPCKGIAPGLNACPSPVNLRPAVQSARGRRRRPAASSCAPRGEQHAPCADR